VKKRLAKLGWFLVRRYDPNGWNLYKKAAHNYLSRLIYDISPTETPFLHEISRGCESGNEFEWGEDKTTG